MRSRSLFLKKKFPLSYLGCALWLGLLCIISYRNSFHHDFLLDDHLHIVGPKNLGTVSMGTLLTDNIFGFYRPLGFLVLKGLFSILGQKGECYHMANLILFGGVCFLFYVILRQMLQDPAIPVMAVSLFVVHPIHNVFVNYKTSSTNLIFILCMQLSTLFMLLFVRHKTSFSNSDQWLSPSFFPFKSLWYLLSLL